MSRTTVKVAPPPIPADPSICRWCGLRKRAFFKGGPLELCDNACEPNDSAPHLGHCQACGRDFETGRKLMQSPLCFECEGIELAQTVEMGRGAYVQYAKYDSADTRNRRWRMR